MVLATTFDSVIILAAYDRLLVEHLYKQTHAGPAAMHAHIVSFIM